MLGLGLGFVGTRSLAPGNAAPELVASPTRIIYDTMRGEATPPRVEHADSKSAYVLIEVAVPPGAENITVKMGDLPEQKLTLSPDGFASFLAERGRPNSPTTGSLSYTLQKRAALQRIDIPESLRMK